MASTPLLATAARVGRVHCAARATALGSMSASAAGVATTSTVAATVASVMAAVAATTTSTTTPTILPVCVAAITRRHLASSAAAAVSTYASSSEVEEEDASAAAAAAASSSSPSSFKASTQRLVRQAAGAGQPQQHQRPPPPSRSTQAARDILRSLRGLKRRQTTRFGGMRGPPTPMLSFPRHSVGPAVARGAGAGVTGTPAVGVGSGNSLAFGQAFGGRPPNGAPVRRRKVLLNGVGGGGGSSSNSGYGTANNLNGGRSPNGASLVSPSLLQGGVRPSAALAQGRPRVPGAAAAAAAPSLIQGPRPPQIPITRPGLAQGRITVNGAGAAKHHRGGGVNGGEAAPNGGGGGVVNGGSANGYRLNGILGGSAFTTSLDEDGSSSGSQSGRPKPRSYESDLVVVLDMDECLVHSQFLSRQMSSSSNPQRDLLAAPTQDKYRQDEPRPSRSPAFDADEEAESIIACNCEYFRVKLPDGDLVHVNKRPRLDEFLAAVCSRFETHVFTAAVGVYADPLLDRLDPDGSMFVRRLYRESCTHDPDLGAYVKDLHGVLGGRSPWGSGVDFTGSYSSSSDVDSDAMDEMFAKYNEGRVVLVDNNPLSFLAQPSNGILVSNFYDDPKDATLEAVVELLDYLDGVGDVRPVLDERFGLAEALGDVIKYSDSGGWR